MWPTTGRCTSKNLQRLFIWRFFGGIRENVQLQKWRFTRPTVFLHMGKSALQKLYDGTPLSSWTSQRVRKHHHLQRAWWSKWGHLLQQRWLWRRFWNKQRTLLRNPFQKLLPSKHYWRLRCNLQQAFQVHLSYFHLLRGLLREKDKLEDPDGWWRPQDHIHSSLKVAEKGLWKEAAHSCQSREIKGHGTVG